MALQQFTAEPLKAQKLDANTVPSRAGVYQAASDVAGQVMKTAGALGEHFTTMEVASIQNGTATARAEMARTLADFERDPNADPADTKYLSTFGEKVDNILERYGGNLKTAGGRRAYEAMAGQLKGEFLQRADAARIEALGARAKAETVAAINTSRALLFGDPTQFSSVLMEQATLLSLNTELPESVKQELALQMRTEFAMSTVQGIGYKNPKMGIDQLVSGMWDFYIDPDKKVALIRQFEGDIVSRASADEAAANRMKKVANEEALKQIIKEHDAGKLTQEFIEERYAALSGDNYKYAYSILRNGTENDDVRAIGDLLTTLNEDPLLVQRKAVAYMDQGRIKTTTAKSYVDSASAKMNQEGIESPRERGFRLLGTLKPGPLDTGSLFENKNNRYLMATQAYVEAISEPGLTNEDIEKIANRTLRAFAAPGSDPVASMYSRTNIGAYKTFEAQIRALDAKRLELGILHDMGRGPLGYQEFEQRLDEINQQINAILDAQNALGYTPEE